MQFEKGKPSGENQDSKSYVVWQGHTAESSTRVFNFKTGHPFSGRIYVVCV